MLHKAVLNNAGNAHTIDAGGCGHMVAFVDVVLSLYCKSWKRLGQDCDPIRINVKVQSKSISCNCIFGNNSFSL
jgi:hypothetical protein